MDFDLIQPGLKAQMHKKVLKKHSVAPGGPTAGYILSSPSMIGLMENTCVEALRSQMQPGFTTVGYHVDIRHLAPTSLGESVFVQAELKEVDGNKLTFSVAAYFGQKLIGSGLHRRAIIKTKPALA